jgi:hypothetical protein
VETSGDARAQFQFLDKNVDGFLDLVELHNGLSDYGFTDAAIEAIFIDLDVNKDGLVSEEEFIATYAKSFLESVEKKKQYKEQQAAEAKEAEEPAAGTQMIVVVIAGCLDVVHKNTNNQFNNTYALQQRTWLQR